MYSILHTTLLLASLTLSAHALPQSNPQTENTTAVGNSISFEKLVTDRLVALRPTTPDLQIKFVLVEAWEDDPSSEAEDFARIKLVYHSDSYNPDPAKKFLETSHDPWRPGNWSAPTVSDNTWSNCKPFRWQDVSSTIYSQLLALKNQGIDRKYQSVKMQKLRKDFNAGNDQIYWVWEEGSGDRRFWQGDVDQKAYHAFDQDQGHFLPAGTISSNSSNVEEMTSTS